MSNKKNNCELKKLDKLATHDEFHSFQENKLNLYTQHNLSSDILYYAKFQDTTLKNPWGIAIQSGRNSNICGISSCGCSNGGDGIAYFFFAGEPGVLPPSRAKALILRRMTLSGSLTQASVTKSTCLRSSLPSMKATLPRVSSAGSPD